MIDKKRLSSRNTLLATMILAAVIILFFGVMFYEPPEPKFPELTVSFFDKEIDLTSFTRDLRVNVILSFPDKEIWDLDEVSRFAETVTIESSVPVKRVEYWITSGNSVICTLTFDNTLVKNFLWSHVYHMGLGGIHSQIVSITVYGDWQGSEISGSEELTVFQSSK